MNPTVCTHKNNPNFWIFGLFFFLYFFIMATCFPFLPIWLSDVIGLNKTETGLVFSSLSLFAICFQPILGVISDKLGLKKHLMWIVTVLLVLIAPFFLYVFAPLLKTNIWLGALSGGAYIGFAFSAGAGAMEAYIERVSRNSGFEYGKARTFGCLGWALCATTAGMLFSINPEWVFWMGSAAALLLVVLVAIAKPQASQSAQVLHALEVPFLLVGAFKYITGVFDVRLSATIYLVGFQFAKQVAAIFLSAFAGNMYDRIGFQDTYMILGGIALTVTLISAFTLAGKTKTEPLRDNAMTV